MDDNKPASPTCIGKRRRIDSKKSGEGDLSSKKDPSQQQGQQATVPPAASKRCNRNSLLIWDTTKKGIFFDGINEFGKDFDKVHNYFNTKIKKVYGNVDTYHAIKKEQVRDFFQNTLKKTSQIVDMKKLHNLIIDEGSVTDGMIREYREVLCLLCYWQVMKHSKRIKWPTDKLHNKVNEIIFHGSTCLRIGSRNFYVHRQTPKYYAGQKSGKVPTEFTVDILPFNNWSWGIVQNIAQNPRIRLKVSSKKSVAEIIKLLLSKWERAKTSSTLETLNLCLRAPSSSKYKTPDAVDADKGRKRSSCSQSDEPVKGKPRNRARMEEAGKEDQENELNPEEEEEEEVLSDSMIVNNIAKEIDVRSSEHPLEPDNITDFGDVVTSPAQMYQDTNVSITEEDLDELIENVNTTEVVVETDCETPPPPRITPSHKAQPRKVTNAFFQQKSRESEEVSAERERLVALDFWDETTPALLTIGHIFTKFGCPGSNREFHIEYEWRLSSGQTKMNSAHNTLALQRLFNLGNTEFQRISKQGKFRDLFIALNWEKWTGVLPSCKSTESQTDPEEPRVPPKAMMVNAAVQVGKDRLILPQPTKLGGFIVPAPAPAPTPKTPPNNSFNLPKRPPAKRKQPVQRVILPKPSPHVAPSQLVVSRDIGCAGQVKAAPYCRENGVDLNSLIPDSNQLQSGQPSSFFAYNSTDYDQDWTRPEMSTLNSLVAEHSNHSLPGDHHHQSRDPDLSRDQASILDQLSYTS